VSIFNTSHSHPENTMAAPVQPTNQQASAGLIDDKDVEHWKQKFSDLLAKPSEHLESKSPETAREFHTGLFECFTPIDTCTSGSAVE
jgi:hypothetical protein